MILAGLQKTSLIDYPGKVSCVAFITGCNFTCPFCQNPDLAKGHYPQRIDSTHFIDFLSQRKSLLEAVVISGGEPTLCPDLPELCRSIRDLDMAVKLDTNGSRPKVIERLLRSGHVDFIAMDLKTTLERYAPPIVPAHATNQNDQRIRDRIHQTIQMIMQSGVAYEFRTTCVRPFVTRTVIEHIAQTIQGARQYTLQTFRRTDLLNPDFFDQSDPDFSSDEMAELQTLAAPWVENCLIR